MRTELRWTFVIALTIAAAPAAVVNFDDLPASTGGAPTPGGVTPFVGQTVPVNYSSLVTFAVPTGALFVYAEANVWSNDPPASRPNVVCPAQVALASSSMCVEPLLVTFTQPVNALSFWAGAWDDVGSLLRIEVFTGVSQLATQIQVTSPQRNNTHGVINVSALSGVANITGLRILSPSSSLTSGAGDRNGLVYDNFAFDGGINPPGQPEVPEPSTAALLLAGGLLLATRWRR